MPCRGTSLPWDPAIGPFHVENISWETVSRQLRGREWSRVFGGLEVEGRNVGEGEAWKDVGSPKPLHIWRRLFALE